MITSKSSLTTTGIEQLHHTYPSLKLGAWLAMPPRTKSTWILWIIIRRSSNFFFAATNNLQCIWCKTDTNLMMQRSNRISSISHSRSLTRMASPIWYIRVEYRDAHMHVSLSSALKLINVITFSPVISGRNILYGTPQDEGNCWTSLWKNRQQCCYHCPLLTSMFLNDRP